MNIFKHCSLGHICIFIIVLKQNELTVHDLELLFGKGRTIDNIFKQIDTDKDGLVYIKFTY